MMPGDFTRIMTLIGTGLSKLIQGLAELFIFALLICMEIVFACLSAILWLTLRPFYKPENKAKVSDQATDKLTKESEAT